MNTTQINLHVDPIQFSSEQDKIEACKLTGANIQYLKNLLSECLNDLAALPVTPEQSQDYFAKVSFIRGQIAAYSHLIQTHEAAHNINQEN